MIYSIEKLIIDSNKKFLRNIDCNFSLDFVSEASVAYYKMFLCDTEYDNELIQRYIIQAIPKIIKNNLNRNEQDVIFLNFYKNQSEISIAEELGCSVQNISRIKKNALKKIGMYLAPFIPDK